MNNINDNYEPTSIIALGYKGDNFALPKDISKLENNLRERKPMNDIVFKNNFK